MIYLEELLEAIISEEGQTLMGLEFLTETLSLPMKNLELIFRKAVSEYSERRPMKVTEVFNSIGSDGVIILPEGTTSCRIARYGFLPNQIPRFFINKFDEQNIEFDPYTRQCKVWPPVVPLRLTYTKRYTVTKTNLISGSYIIPYETDEYNTTLQTMFAGKTLVLSKDTITKDPSTGKDVVTTLTMVPTGSTEDEDIFGNKTYYIQLEGTLGTGTLNVGSRDLDLQLLNTEPGAILYSYYPKYYTAPEIDFGDRLFTKLFACKFLTSLASLRAQATQERLHNIDLTSDDLYGRAQELKRELREELKNTISFGDMAPM